MVVIGGSYNINKYTQTVEYKRPSLLNKQITGLCSWERVVATNADEQSQTRIFKIGIESQYNRDLQWELVTGYEYCEPHLKKQTQRSPIFYAPESSSTMQNILLAGMLRYDTREHKHKMERGTKTIIESNLSFPFEQDYASMLYCFAEHTRFIPGKHFLIAGKSGIGYLFYERSKKSIPNKFLSFQERAVSRGNFHECDSYCRMHATVEVHFPLFGALSGVCFSDGLVALCIDKSTLNDSYTTSTINPGIGLHYQTPLGPIRFDIAWNLDSSSVNTISQTKTKFASYKIKPGYTWHLTLGEFI